MSRSLLVVAGEVSGDLHAGAVLEALRKKDPSLHVFGIGGDRMAAAGVELVAHAGDMAVFGPVAALLRYRFFRRRFMALLRAAASRGPAAALLVDYGGFNLRLARQLKRRGVKVIYYISPQVWASRPKRIRRMAEAADLLLVIFPFEPEVYRGTGLRVEFVGHPLVDEIAAFRATAETGLPWGGTERIALLPGSRRQEVELLLPALLQTARRIARLRPDAGFLIAAPGEDMARVARERLAASSDLPAGIEVVVNRTREVLRQARAAIVTSGTATLETALLGCPMVIVYKTSPLLYYIARRMVRVPHIGMVNLIAGGAVCPELIQGDVTGAAVAQGLLPLLDDTRERREQCAALAEIAGRLGEGGAAARVCEHLCRAIHPSRA